MEHAQWDRQLICTKLNFYEEYKAARQAEANAEKRVNFLAQKMKDADAAREKLAAGKEAIAKKQQQVKDAMTEARKLADELKPACVDGVTKYWVRARQAKMIEDAKAVRRVMCVGGAGEEK